VASAVSPPRAPPSVRPSTSAEAPTPPAATAAAEAPAPAAESSPAAPVAPAAPLAPPAPPAPVRPPPDRPVLAASGLYGQAFAVGGGRLRFAPTARLEDW
jgi:hypothetical protein